MRAAVRVGFGVEARSAAVLVETVLVAEAMRSRRESTAKVGSAAAAPSTLFPAASIDEADRTRIPEVGRPVVTENEVRMPDGQAITARRSRDQIHALPLELAIELGEASGAFELTLDRRKDRVQRWSQAVHDLVCFLPF